MRLRRNARALTSWIAVLAVLMAALAPSISHALGSNSASPWSVVCTSIGVQWVQTDADSADPSPGPGAAHAFEHCPYCSLHANAVAIPAAPSAGVPCISATDEPPVAVLVAPRTLSAWVSPQPRAPPLFS